jgi:hypothetical protein
MSRTASNYSIEIAREALWAARSLARTRRYYRGLQSEYVTLLNDYIRADPQVWNEDIGEE